MTTDLSDRIAGLASLIEARLDADEATARAVEDNSEPYPGQWAGDEANFALRTYNGWSLARAVTVEEGFPPGVLPHIVRNDPARVLRRVKATRELKAAILAEPHDYVEGDPWFSCSQATVPGEDGEPGSGCVDDERAGKPCDCGRDARVARLLGIVASAWEDS